MASASANASANASASANATASADATATLAQTVESIREEVEACCELLDTEHAPPEEPVSSWLYPGESQKQLMSFKCKPHLQAALDGLDKSNELCQSLATTARTAHGERARTDRTQVDTDRAQMVKDRAQMDTDRAQIVKDRVQVDTDRAQMDEDLAQMAKDRAQMDTDRAQLAKDRAQIDKDRAELNEERMQLDKTRQGVEIDRHEQSQLQAKDDETERQINAELVLLTVSIPETQSIIAMASSPEEQPSSVSRTPFDSESPWPTPTARSQQFSESTSPTATFEAAADSEVRCFQSDQSNVPEQEHCQLQADGQTIASDLLFKSIPPPYTSQTSPGLALAATPISLKRNTIEVSLESVGPGGAQINGDTTMQLVLKSFRGNAKIPVTGRYKSGKSTVARKLMGFPNSKCLQHPVHNTKGINMFANVKASEPVFIDVEGFSQPVTNMDPYFLRELVVQFCASVSRCIILVVNHIDITDLQLIGQIQNIAKGTIVVVHNLVTVKDIADIRKYKDQISCSLRLEPIGDFGLCNADRNLVHYVIGNLADDKLWNIQVDPRRKETVFDEIKRTHCVGGIFNHCFQDTMRNAFSKVVSKYFEPDAAAVASVTLSVSENQPWEANYFSELAWRAVRTPHHKLVLDATYVAPMRRAVEMRGLQPHSSITWSWLRGKSQDRDNMRVYLVVDCPGFVLSDIKFLNNAIIDYDSERTILLIGTQQVYGRVALPIRELIKSPLPLVQRQSDVRKTIEDRQYDKNGSVILSFVPNVQSSVDLETVKATFLGLHEWNRLDHRILSCPTCAKAGKDASPCECKTCVAAKDKKE